MKGPGEASKVVTFYFPPDQLNSKGVCILVNPSLGSSLSIENFSKDRDGRIVTFLLTSILKPPIFRYATSYAPNDS